MIIIYTGNGKGKTSACVGQAIRALGSGLRVAFGQFMKKDVEAGEQAMLHSLLGKDFFPAGLGFLFDKKDKAPHAQAAAKLVDWALQQIEEKDMVVLDECLYALGMEVLHRTDVEKIIAKAREKDVHLVLSGRGLPDWLKETADLVSELLEVKHPYHVGVAAQKGIEF